jgi:hypothetical protein
VPAPTQQGLLLLREQARRIGRFLPKVASQEWFEMPMMYAGAKRARYLAATEQLLSGSLSRKDATVRMFVKFEKFNPGKVNPDPRAIQFRSAKYCVALGKYLKSVEHALYALKGDGRILPNTRVIGKGLSMGERASLLRKKWEAFDCPIVVSLDASRFDMHVSRELLQIEHNVYLRMCNDRTFARLLSWQLDNKCISSLGLKYLARGRRMSGDMNTALGNCLLMVIMVSTIMRGHKYDILDDGDDCLLIIEKDTLPFVLEKLPAMFLEFGHEIKIENIAEDFECVEWCQSRPVEYSTGKFKFVRLPWKVLSTALSGIKYVEANDKVRRRLVNTIGMAEMILNLGIPILQEYGIALMRNADTPLVQRFDDIDSLYYRLHRELKALNMKQLEKRDPQPITPDARWSFYRAFGITPDDQVVAEDFLRTWSFSLLGDLTLPVDIDIQNWTSGPMLTSECYHLGE